MYGPALHGARTGIDVAELNAVFLDHDGTLVDTEPYWIEAELLLPQRYGAVWTEADSIACVGSPMPVTAARMQEAGVPLSVEEIIDDLCAQVIVMMDERGIPWLPGATELVAALAEDGIPVAVVSNAWRSVVEKSVSALPLGAVKFLLTGDEMVRAKPDPWPYAFAAEQLGVDPAGQVAVEDSLAGTLSAEAAGMRVLVVPGVAPVPDAAGRSRTDSLANVTVDDLRAIAAGDVLMPNLTTA
jgi:HAD superfamily hydrolase (TIGR01509 family)